MNKKKESIKEIVCQNRKARHEYFIIDEIECGIVLVGSEIKSVRNHKVSLDGSYAIVTDGEVWLLSANIDPYKNSHCFNHEPKRQRKLLLKKKEIENIAEKAQQKGNTLIPLTVYLENGLCKVSIGVCRGKQLHDKRAVEKEKDSKKEIRKFK